MKYIIQNKNKEEVNLTDTNFICEGGEGRIYGRNNTIYKIYFEKKKVISKNKIIELKNIDDPTILRPLDLLLDSNLMPVGFTMRWIKDIIPICKLFTNDFRNRFNISPQKISTLVNNMVNKIHFIHSKNCLIVDGNEMNYMVSSSDFTIPYFIDVDSYQTEHFPATAIMTSIKDYHTKGFNEFSDWFSFAVVAIQLFIGIHPYKGNHPKYNRIDLEKRMKDNVSIFNKDTTLPATVRDFSYIPDNYRQWFIDIFEKGKRSLPPTLLVQLNVVVIKKVIKDTNLFEIEKVMDIEKIILDIETFTTLDTNEVITVYIKDRKLILENKNKKLNIDLDAFYIMTMENSVFIINENRLIEVSIIEMNNKLIPIIQSNWNVLPNSTKLFKGLIYQNVLGKPYFMIPYKLENGKTGMFQEPIEELKNYDVLEAKYSFGVAFVIARQGNVFSRFIFKFNDCFKYNCVIDKNVDFHLPNFVVLDNGIVVSINFNDDVEIFHKSLDKPNIKVMKDSDVDFNMKLCKVNGNVHFIKDNQLFRIKIK